MRTAHYVASTHWDREWYEPFQGFRIRLVSLLDEVIATLERDRQFKAFVTDGQAILLYDYLDVRPERRELVCTLVKAGRLKVGPWYVLPDEWLPSGESLIRNLQLGMELARDLGGESRAGFVCDEFGHTSQLPQIYAQLGITAAMVWRGTHENEIGRQFRWIAPDGTVMPTCRFGANGYVSYYSEVRKPAMAGGAFDLAIAVEKMVQHVVGEAKRPPVGPILIFDGGDHIEIEPQTSALIARANEQLAAHGIRLIHSDLDAYALELRQHAGQIEKSLTGELRESSREGPPTDEQWLIPGVLSSRIPLKQANAACEDELCLWAEPFCAFAAPLGLEYPAGFLRIAWKHLIENHPHDSICGCSIDAVHKDMAYRFDQSLAISSRLTMAALRRLTASAAPAERPEKSLVLGVFNPTADALDEPVDLDIPLPTDWPTKFREFFGYEEKFAFILRDAEGHEVPWQLVDQRRGVAGFRRARYRFPTTHTRHVVSVTAPLCIPAMGYTTLTVEPAPAPTRHLGSMAISHRAIENEYLRIEVNPNGSVNLTDKRTGRTFHEALTFEDRADIGDGWFWGMAVNDQAHTSAASHADVALVADGLDKATFRIAVTVNVPRAFDFAAMRRSADVAPLRIVSDVTLRRGADRVEISITVENTILDHRLRVLFPTDLAGDTYLADAAFDVVERPVATAADNAHRRELDVDGRPQQTWTAFSDGKLGLALISRGLPESGVCNTAERPVFVTLLRAFRRAVMSNDNPGGQIQGSHTFRLNVVPFAGPAPRRKLSILGQRILSPTRAVALAAEDLAMLKSEQGAHPGQLPRAQSFLNLEGDVVVTSIQRDAEGLLLRLFNPATAPADCRLALPPGASTARAVDLEGKPQPFPMSIASGQASFTVPPKRIVTLRLGAK